MLVHKVSTMVSTWYSFTLLTRGPRLWKTHTPTVDTHAEMKPNSPEKLELVTFYHLTARF